MRASCCSRSRPTICRTPAFPFATSREIELGYALVRASRITYVGELGWELYVPPSSWQGVYDELIEAGARHGLVHAGYHALNSLRVEKAYRHFGHDISRRGHAARGGARIRGQAGQAGRLHRPRGVAAATRFRGRQAAPAVSIALREPLLYHNEPIWRGGAIVGYVRSGMFAHTLGAAVGLGYVAVPAGSATAGASAPVRST